MTNDRFVNRELSWLEFNRRVLEEAQDPTTPLLERVKFLAIFSSNLDEFFMVRMAGLKRQLHAGDLTVGPDGMNAAETIAAVSATVHELAALQHRVFLEEIQPLLAAEGVSISAAQGDHRGAAPVPRGVLPPHAPARADPAGRRSGPSLPVPGQPIAVRPGLHPAPGAVAAAHHVARRRPHPEPGGAALRRRPRSARQALVHAAGGRDPPAPAEALPRLRDPVLPRHPRHPRRRAAASPRPRRGLADEHRGEPARPAAWAPRCGCSTTPICPARPSASCSRNWSCSPRISTRARGSPRSPISSSSTRPSTSRDSKISRTAAPVRAFEAGPDMWSAIRSGDILVHHPYQSFDTVTRFVREAATDPRVLAIKMTLYRVSPTSPIALALTSAAQNGKEVAVLVELRARFDEEANIRWARALEEVGAHVVYGLVGYKTHCKACLVVRQEPDGIRRYCHLSTGNYNIRTATRVRGSRALHHPRVDRRGSHRAVQHAHRLHPAARLQPPAGGAHRPARRPRRAHPARGGSRAGRAGRRGSSPR